MRLTSPLARFLTRLRRFVTNQFLDLKYLGTFSGPSKKSLHRDLGARDVVYTDYSTLSFVFGEVYHIRPDDVLVEVGCGKGRVIGWWLGQGYRNRIYGLELEEDVAEWARRRFRSKPTVTIISGNAVDSLPEEGTVFYLFNPFREGLMTEFRKRLEETVTRRGGPVTVLYNNCLHADVFENSDRWSVAYHDIPGKGRRLAVIENRR